MSNNTLATQRHENTLNGETAEQLQPQETNENVQNVQPQTLCRSNPEKKETERLGFPKINEKEYYR